MEDELTFEQFWESRRDYQFTGSPSEGDSPTHQSAERNGGGFVGSIVLDSAGCKFPFRCKCGETHRFSYTENKEGIRILKLLI